MGWDTWLRGPSEVAPSLYAADFTRLGEQIEALLDAGCRIFHFDVGDGHFIPPVTIGPVVLRAIAPLIHDAGGVIDCHLMVADPAHHFPEFAESGADSVTFHCEATSDPRGVGRRRPGARARRRACVQSGHGGRRRGRGCDCGEADLMLCMSIVPGYSGQPFLPESYERIEELATLLETPIQVDGGIGEDNVAAVRAAGATRVRRGQRRVRGSGPRGGLSAHRGSCPMSLDRALALAAAAGPVAYPNPTVGAVVVADGTNVGEGVTEAHGGRHGEIVALAAAGDRGARGDALRDDGAVRTSRQDATVRRRDRRSRDRARRRGMPGSEPRGGGRARPASSGGRRGRAGRSARGAAPERGLAHLEGARTPVRHLQGGDHARRASHRARHALDQRERNRGVSYTSCARRRTPWPSAWERCAQTRHASMRVTFRSCGNPGDSPSAAGRCRTAPSSSFARGSSASSSRLSPPRASNRCCSRVGLPWRRRSWTAGLVDRLLVFVAPTIAGAGASLPRRASDVVTLTRSRRAQAGEDVVLEAYVHAP